MVFNTLLFRAIAQSGKTSLKSRHDIFQFNVSPSLRVGRKVFHKYHLTLVLYFHRLHYCQSNPKWKVFLGLIFYAINASQNFTTCGSITKNLVTPCSIILRYSTTDNCLLKVNYAVYSTLIWLNKPENELIS